MRKKALPLTGLRILVGRARHQAGPLSSALRDLGAEVLEIPFIEIRKPRSYKPLDRALQNLETYDWLILTSVNGVDAVWERLNKLHATNSKLAHLKIAAIGPATANAIRENGAHVHIVPKEYVAESVVRSMHSRVMGKRVLLARARVARDIIPRELRKLGAHVDVVEAYETIIPQSSRRRLKAALKSKARRPHLIMFTSSSTVRNFTALLEGSAPRGSLKQLDGILFASIGPVTSATLRQLGLRAGIEAKQYTIPGLVAAIVSAAVQD
jgi:uroporphyrinogen-III synthase